MSDANEVKRWELSSKSSDEIEITPSPQGDWVKIEDHDRIVADLKAEIVRLSRPVSAICTKCGYDKPANLYEQTIARQARVIEKLREQRDKCLEYVSFERSIMDKELEAIEQGDGT
jgi:hypothetical protein